MKESSPSKSSNKEKNNSFLQNSTKSNSKNVGKSGKPGIGIPKPVANRMARRIAITTGLPTISGMGVFVGSYILITRGIMEIAPGITLISSAACFLLGLLGLSYGILSASWDKDSGTLLGLENIRPNIGRMREAFKSQEQSSSSNKSN